MLSRLDPNVGLKVFDIKLYTKTAGPSPDDNIRTEVFLCGCKKAKCGDPCRGCFNAITWDDTRVEWSIDPIELAADINEKAVNKYVTIGGGEPTDQIDNLIILAKELKKYGFHIMTFTWRDLEYVLNDKPPASQNNIKYPIEKEKVEELLKHIDIIVDSEYHKHERLYKDDTNDGFFGSIGSGNQRIWDVRNMRYEYMRDLKGLKLDDNGDVIYVK